MTQTTIKGDSDDTGRLRFVNLKPMQWVYKLPATVRRIVYPPTCLFCDAPGQPGRNLCADCQAELPWNQPACRQCALPLPAESHAELCGQCINDPPPFDAAYAPFCYDEKMRWLIGGLKFRQQLGHARLLGDLVAEHLANTDIERPNRLIPVPLHRSRLRQRGYNQALEIARPVASLLDLKIDSRSLRRIRATPPQMELKLKERKRNIRGAFACNTQLAGEHVALIDDVVTSGHTVREVASMLRKAGAERISIWSVARAAAPGSSQKIVT